MQGIWITLGNSHRPHSKKEVKETVTTAPHAVVIEATSIMGNEYDGSVENAPDGEYYFVGPDPHTNRKFYGTITKRNGVVKVK